ncbi:MAG: hypothetical protein WA137_12900 [Methanothrix sp.]
MVVRDVSYLPTSCYFQNLSGSFQEDIRPHRGGGAWLRITSSSNSIVQPIVSPRSSFCSRTRRIAAWKASRSGCFVGNSYLHILLQHLLRVATPSLSASEQSS